LPIPSMWSSSLSKAPERFPAGQTYLSCERGADPRAEVAGLVVDASCRSRGIGAMLMARTEEWAREHGCAAVTLRSNVIRERAHRFYERLGYQIVKTQKSFRKTL
jgi:GNAT superfamily N-acetyltransferase